MLIYKTRSNLRNGGLIWAHGLKAQSITVGKVRQEELEAAAHIQFSVRKREMNAGAKSDFSFLCSPGPRL